MQNTEGAQRHTNVIKESPRKKKTYSKKSRRAWGGWMKKEQKVERRKERERKMDGDKKGAV